MLGFVVCCIALAISAVYELIEWWAALALGQGADEFLGTRGDPWDTQSDMFCALLGALTTVLRWAAGIRSSYCTSSASEAELSCWLTQSRSAGGKF